MAAPNHKLTEDIKDQIYREWRVTGYSNLYLADKYEISEPAISRILTMKHQDFIVNRKLIDAELEKIANIKANNGKDSTDEEKRDAIRQEAELVENIKRIDKQFFITIEPDNDKKK